MVVIPAAIPALVIVLTITPVTVPALVVVPAAIPALIIVPTITPATVPALVIAPAIVPALVIRVARQLVVVRDLIVRITKPAVNIVFSLAI